MVNVSGVFDTGPEQFGSLSDNVIANRRHRGQKGHSRSRKVLPNVVDHAIDPVGDIASARHKAHHVKA